MQLSLEGVIPIPLRDKLSGRKSGLWQSTVSFNKGEYIFIQAPSGTGKTTLIHILYSLRKDYEGDVLWNKNSLTTITAEDLSELRKKNISIIFQDMRLFPELTAIENLQIKRSLTDTVSEQEVISWFHRLGIKDKQTSLAATLSYGEQQRVAIIRSLVQPFDWLLMDEPFSHLDHANTNKAIDLISEVVKRNNAGIFLADLDHNTYFPYTKTLQL